MAILSNYLAGQRAKIVLPYIKGSILDLGCGNALPLQFAKEKIDIYYGVEHRQKKVDELSRKFPEHKFFARDLDVDELSFDMKFDTILVIAVIEHILNQKHFITQILRNAKPNAKIVITTPTPFGDYIHKIGSRLGLFAKSAVHRHIIIFSPERLRMLANYFNMNVEQHRKFQFGCNQLGILAKPKTDNTV